MKKLILFLALTGAAFAQSFPSSIYVPPVAADNIATTLSSAMLSGDTVAVVTSGAGWLVGMKAYICDGTQTGTAGKCSSTFEIMKVTNVAGNILTVTRAQDGTAAIGHAKGKAISNSIIASYVNGPNNEIAAVEAALGVNLANVNVSVTAARYNFTPQTPGGSLTGGGGAQTITLAPCPLGIVTTGAGATALYLSNGTGTAEWKRPTGGTCTSGATTGTVVLSPTNNHTGSWTIQSATAGIDLACSSSALGANVVIAPGSYDIFGTIIPANGCTIDGLGSPSANGPSGSVFLHMQTNGIPMFDVLSHATTIKNLQLSFGTYPAYTVAGSPATAGSVCIHLEPSEATGSTPYVNNIVCNNFYNNLIANNGTLRIQNFSSLQAVQDGIVIGGAPGVNAGYMEAVISQASGGNGYTLGAQSAVQWHNVNCFNNQGWGMQINALAAFHMDNIDCESDKLGEINITGTVNSVGILQNVILQGAGATYSWGTNTSAPGLKIDSVVALGLLISNIQVSGAQGNGMELGGLFAQINNASVYGNGVGAQSGHTACLTAPGSDMILSGVYCYQGPAVISGSGNIIIGSQFLGPVVATPSIQFTAASQANNFCNNTVSNAGNTAIQYDAGTTGMACINSVIGTVTGRLGYDSETIRTIPIEPIPNATALSVASNVIAPTLPLHTVGAGLIKTITPLNAAVSGCVDLIATAAFTTDTSVNIVTPAITATAGKLYHACYNAGTALWSLTN